MLYMYKGESLPCLALRMGNGSPSFQNKYMKKTHIPSDRNLATLRLVTENETKLIYVYTLHCTTYYIPMYTHAQIGQIYICMHASKLAGVLDLSTLRKIA